jgi:hypothetical protein
MSIKPLPVVSRKINRIYDLKYVLLIIATVLILIGSGIVGFIKRQTYTDITRESNFLDTMKVAEIPEAIALNGVERMYQSLPLAPLIIRVTVTGSLECFNGFCRQKVKVQEIYKGNGLVVGDDFLLTSKQWLLIRLENDRAIERGFVNIMETESEYLVFLNGEVESLYDDLPVYEANSDPFVTAVFSYEDHTNVIVPIEEGQPTYVPYNMVRENEFFADTQIGMDALLALKDTMIEAYPRDEHTEQ